MPPAARPCRRTRRLLAAAPAAALLVRAGVGQQHRLARFLVGALERAPPGFDFRRHFAARRAQREEIVGHAEARQLEQPVRALAGALLEARLHRPDLAHGRGEPARDGELAALRVEHLVHRRLRAPGCARSPRFSRAFQAASTSCQSSAANRNAGDTGRSASTRSSVCASASVTKRSPSGWSRITSSSGSMPLCSPSLRSWRRQALAWPESSSLSISSNRRGGGTCSSSGARRLIGARVAPSIVRPSLAREPHRAQHAHRVLAKARLRVADHAQRALFQVGEAAVVVDHLARLCSRSRAR